MLSFDVYLWKQCSVFKRICSVHIKASINSFFYPNVLAMEVFKIYFNVCICCYRQIIFVWEQKIVKKRQQHEIRCNVVHHSTLKSQKVNEKKIRKKDKENKNQVLLNILCDEKKSRKKIIKTRWYDFKSEFSSWRGGGWKRNNGEKPADTVCRSPTSWWQHQQKKLQHHVQEITSENFEWNVADHFLSFYGSLCSEINFTEFREIKTNRENRKRPRVRTYVKTHTIVRLRAHTFVCVCVCVLERNIDRLRERERGGRKVERMAIFLWDDLKMYREFTELMNSLLYMTGKKNNKMLHASHLAHFQEK